MDSEEKIILEREAKKYFGKKVHILEKNASGEKERRIYLFKDIGGIGIEIGENDGEDNIFYHLRAILEKHDGSNRIDVIPLSEVLKAIKNSEVIDYHRF